MRVLRYLLLSALILSCSDARPQRLPNIVFILADDLGYTDIEGFGAAYSTPNLLQLQRQGMKFTQFYSQPQCSPSRAALMTGSYPQRVGIPWVVGPEGPAWTKDKAFIGLNPTETTLPEMLKEKGYATAAIGKWHLGHHRQHLPVHHGFDEYFGIPYSNDMWPPNGEYPELPLVEGEKTVETNPDQSQLVKRYTERALSFIRTNKQKPFFLYLAHNMPHVPLFASSAFVGHSGKGLYADVIQEIDWSTGEIMKCLKENRLDRNTIFIFTSDNGPWLVYGNHAGSANGLREGKATTFEGGVRVPFIIRWPGKIAKGSVTNASAALIDILPTLAEVVGANPGVYKIDGVSLLPLITGKSSVNKRDVHYYYQINELQAIRKGKWKLHLPHGYEHVDEAGRDGLRGKSGTADLELSLFDLERDPGEADNVASSHPDIVAELSRLGEEFRNELSQNSRKPATSN